MNSTPEVRQYDILRTNGRGAVHAEPPDTSTSTLRIKPNLIERCGITYGDLIKIYGNGLQVEYAEYEGYYSARDPNADVWYDFYDEDSFTGEWGDLNYLDEEMKTSIDAICYKVAVMLLVRLVRRV